MVLMVVQLSKKWTKDILDAFVLVATCNLIPTLQEDCDVVYDHGAFHQKIIVVVVKLDISFQTLQS